MKQLLSFYNSRISTFENQLKKVKKQLFLSSMLRLLVFLIAVFLVYYFFGNMKLVLAVIFGTIIIFLFLVTKHTGLQYQRDKISALMEQNKTEVNVLHRDFMDLPDGEEFKDPLHYFSQDIDLFGKKSFFQYLNRTSLTEGKRRLATILTGNDIHKIEDKQEAIKELAKKVDFRQEFSATASLVKTEDTSDSIIKWFSSYAAFVPKIFNWASTLFSLLSLGVITCYFFDFVSGAQLALWFLIGLMITGFYLKKINNLSTKVDRVQDVFQQYHQLLALLEETDFSSEFLKKRLENIRSEGKKSSGILKDFSKTIDALDQRSNLIFGMLGNGFLLWDLRQSYRLEKWIAQHSKNVAQWFELIEFMDAYNSLGNFAYNHPQYTFPTITEGEIVIEAKNAVHP